MQTAECCAGFAESAPFFALVRQVAGAGAPTNSAARRNGSALTVDFWCRREPESRVVMNPPNICHHVSADTASSGAFSVKAFIHRFYSPANFFQTISDTMGQTQIADLPMA